MRTLFLCPLVSFVYYPVWETVIVHFGHIFVPAARCGSGIWRFSPRRPFSTIGQVRPSRPSLRLFFRILFGYSRMRRPAREALNAGVAHAACNGCCLRGILSRM